MWTGAAAMLANAWLARVSRSRARESTDVSIPSPALDPSAVSQRRLQTGWVAESVLYVLLALGLLVTGIVLHSPDNWIAPRLALVALACAASIYVVPLFELPVLGQVLLVFAQVEFFADIVFEGMTQASPVWSATSSRW